MVGFRVTPDQLATLGAEALAVAVAAGDAHEVLARRLAPLAAGDWEGPASERFAELWRRYEHGAITVHRALEDVGRLLAAAAQAYALAEDDAAAAFR